MPEENSSREFGEKAVEIFSTAGERIPGSLISALVAFGILFFLVGSIFRLAGLTLFGFLMVIGGPYLGLGPGGILRREQVMESWSILIEKGKGKADEVFEDTESFLKELPFWRTKEKPTFSKILATSLGFKVGNLLIK